MSKAGISSLVPLLLLAGIAFLTQARELDQLGSESLALLKPSHPKLESGLSRIADWSSKGNILAAKQKAEKLGIKFVQDKVRVIIVAERKRDKDIIRKLKAFDVQVEGTYQNLIQALAPPRALGDLASIPGINFIQPPNEPIPAAVISQGVGLIGADDYHDVGYKGEGVKIAVLDKGFTGYETAQDNGELPETLITKSFYNDTGGNGDIDGNTSHGTACAEVVYDMAPDAQMYLVNSNSVLELGYAVDYLIDQGVDIISYSIGWANEGPYDGTGDICDIVNNARINNGILWVGAAGNQAKRHYQGTFTDDDNDGWHEFASGDETIDISMQYDPAVIYLSWDDWSAPGSSQDYDLYLYDSYGFEYKSETRQTGTQRPIEKIVHYPMFDGPHYVKVKEYFTTRDCYLEIYITHQYPHIDYYNFEHNVESSSLLIPADAAGSFTVGAINWATPNTLEDFSSQGPINVLGGGPGEPEDGTKPDICGPDRVDTFTLGSGAFIGTSASAPHVAGAAALVKCQFPSYDADDIQSVLEGWAVDLGATGKDNLYGSGRLQLGDPTMVVLSSFTVMTGDSKVILFWRTEAEMDNIGFAIYRSDTRDGNYARIAFVPGAQDSETFNDYQLTDEQAQPGQIYYYYLEDVDLSGKRTKSDVIRVSLPVAQASLPVVAVPPQTKLEVLPEQSSLSVNYPNPFNPATWIPYNLAEPADVTIQIYDVRGHLIRTLHPGYQSAGFYLDKDKAAYWDGQDSTGEQVGSGVYYYHLSAGSFSGIRKMVVLE